MKRSFLMGLVTLLPLAVTIWAVHFVVSFLTKPFLGIVMLLTDRLPAGSQRIIHLMNPIFILLALFLLTLFLGFVARKFFFNQILRLTDQAMSKIPLVNKLYKTTKEMVKALFGSNQSSFKQVVMVPFPYPGCYCVGLISREAPNTCSEAGKEALISVFIPTTPNPTTGFLVMCHKSELIYLQMKTEEALKYIVSCAVIQPEKRA